MLLLEKMNRVGKKMLITGRCNITNAADLSRSIKNITGNGRFLYSARAFDNQDVMQFFRAMALQSGGTRQSCFSGKR